MAVSGLEKLAVTGAGVLGGQIAWQSAIKGKTVTVYDLNEDALNNCRTAQQTYEHIYKNDLGATDKDIAETKGRLTFTTDLKQAVASADIVIEAIPEIPKIKTEFYQKMAPLLPDHTILATNSSTLLPSTFAGDTGRPDRFCALHFANLIWSLNIGEIMAHSSTSMQTLTDVTRFAIEIGMVPIPLQKEYNGYICNALLVPIMQAAQSLITTGAATPEYVDRTFMITNRGCAVGPCGLMDIVGMKTCFDILSYWGGVNKDEQMLANAAYIKENFLDKGLQGMQGGQGYYTYPNPSYQADDFLNVPDISRAEEIAKLAQLN
jgi:3-hydroxybutyryl-CoA dehydrogenase